MRVFVTKWFARFARRERLGRESLVEAVARAAAGSIDADLGGGLIKQRVARSGQGRSGGYRTIIAVRLGDRAFFLYGFSKSERSNLEADELFAYKLAAKELLALSGREIETLVKAGSLMELSADD